jgi:hypothetical protein
MGRGFIKLNDGERDWYFEWSTVVDAPTTLGLSRDEMSAYVLDEYGERSHEWWPRSLERLDRYGLSALRLKDPREMFEGNRAGAGESCLSPDEIIACYGRGEHMARDGRCLLKGRHTHSGPEATDDWCRWDEDPPRRLVRGEFAELRTIKDRDKG